MKLRVDVPVKAEVKATGTVTAPPLSEQDRSDIKRRAEIALGCSDEQGYWDRERLLMEIDRLNAELRNA